MRKKITLSLDPDVYDALQELPRKVSISEFISWCVKSAFEDIRRGHVMSDEEFKKWLESSPEAKEFRDRLKEQWGPTARKIDDKLHLRKTQNE